MNSEEYRILSQQIREWLEKDLWEESAPPECSECGGTLIFVPKTGYYTCCVCGLEQDSYEITTQKQFFNQRKNEKLLNLKPKHETRLKRVMRRVKAILIQLCVISDLTYEDAQYFTKKVTSLIRDFRKKDIIRGAGRTIKKVVFALFYQVIWSERIKLQKQLCVELGKTPKEELVKAWITNNGEELRKIDDQSIERYERIKPIQQKIAEFRKAIDQLEKKCPNLLNETPKQLEYILKKFQIPFYDLHTVDPTLYRTLEPELTNLFDLDFFKGVEIQNSLGETVVDKRKIRYEAIITHKQGVNAISAQIIHSFLQNLSHEDLNKKRKGLSCVCTYVAAYLKAIFIISFFERLTGSTTIGDNRSPPFPKPREKWMQFFGVSKATFQKRLNELEKWNPELIKLFKSWEKFHSKGI